MIIERPIDPEQDEKTVTIERQGRFRRRIENYHVPGGESR